MKKDNAFKRAFKDLGGAFFALVIMVAILLIFTDNFSSKINLVNLLKQIVCNCLLSFGLTCCLITGFPDLSVGSHVALATVEVCMFQNLGISLELSILITIVIGIAIGAANGFIFSRTGMPAYIVTLGMQNILRGVAYVLTNGGAVIVNNTKTKTAFFNMANSTMLGGWMPYTTLVLIVAFIVINTMLKRTVFGRHMYAVGGNSSTAIYSGIDVKNIRLIVYTISGLLAAIAGVLTASRVNSGQPTSGVGFEGEAIASSVLGGVSFTGGIGRLSGTLIGIMVMGVMSNGMNLLQINYYWQLVVKGAIILVAVYLDQVKRSKTK